MRSQCVIPDERRDDPGSSGKRGQTTDKTPDSASGPSGVTPILAGLSQAEIEQVANAISDHYKPQGPSDAVPSDPVSIAVALADKLDTLVGFWAIDEKPTGSKDPFALRRAALGVVRTSAGRMGCRLPLGATFTRPFARIGVHQLFAHPLEMQDRIDELYEKGFLSQDQADHDFRLRM